MRSERLDEEPECLRSVYLSITTGCNLSCSYCYIGDHRRQRGQRMTVAEAILILEKIKAFNPTANFAVTGGEPFTHPQLFEILDALEQRHLTFILGSNATLIDDAAARRLKKYRYLHHIQVSLDGMTPDVHGITRGDSWHTAMKGLQRLIKQNAPFSLAPTLHSGNLHEVADIARFAVSNGGRYAPNHLRKFPHAPMAKDISLSAGQLQESIRHTFLEIRPPDRLEIHTDNVKDQSQAVRQQGRCRYVCGNAWFSVDIDWNGDVYPCHLLREKEFILGNILTEEIPVIMERGRCSSTRIKSWDIPKCRECPFVATCAGGCRASGYYNHGTLAAEDEYCQILYQFELDKLFHAKGLTHLSC